MVARWFAFVLLAGCALSIGCGGSTPAESGSGKPRKKPTAVARPRPAPPPMATVPANAFSDVPAALTALQAAIDKDSIPDIRQAETWLSQQGPAAITPLAAEIARTDAREAYRLSCCRALGAIGAPAIGALQTALSSDSALVRMRAAETVGSIRPAAPRTIELLIQLLNDPESRVRQSSMASLERIGEPAKAAAERLQQILNSDANETERDRAKKALKAVNPRHKFFD